MHYYKKSIKDGLKNLGTHQLLDLMSAHKEII
jgi:hypothetical protein